MYLINIDIYLKKKDTNFFIVFDAQKVNWEYLSAFEKFLRKLVENKIVSCYKIKIEFL